MRRRIRPVCAGVARALPRPAKRPGRACGRAAPVRKVVPRPAGGAARDPERDARRLLRPHAHTDEGAAGRSLGEDDLLLALPGQIAAERGRRTALVFDEFQEIVTIDRRYPKLMRAVFQEQPEIAHVYLGSKRHVLERSFDDVNEPFWRSAKRLEIGPIPVAEFARFLHDAPHAQRLVMLALAEEPTGSLYAADYAERRDLPPSPPSSGRSVPW